MRRNACAGAEMCSSASLIGNYLGIKTAVKSELAQKIAGVGNEVASLSWKQLDIQNSDQRSRMPDQILPRLGITRLTNGKSGALFTEYFLRQEPALNSDEQGKLQIKAIDERLI